jgi:S1-C subfamily serine protease
LASTPTKTSSDRRGDQSRNSGGALVNARGELVGINTVIFSQSGGYQGIGFAVSSNLAKKIFSDLQQYQEVRRGSIGPVHRRAADTRQASSLKLPIPRACCYPGSIATHRQCRRGSCQVT